MSDHLTAEVLRRALLVAAEEASIVVVRGAYSVSIVEGADAAAAVLAIDGRLVAQSESTSLSHAASLRSSLPAVLATYPPSGIEPGDVYLVNDVYTGGIHANDLIVFRPVFVDGEAAYVTGTLIHVADLGGLSAGGIAADATDVFLEGIQLPPVRLYQRGEPVDEIFRILAFNSRQPDRTLGDLRALVAGTAVAARRMEALVERHGPDGLAAGIDAFIAYAERRMRQEIAALPDGVYHGAYPVDDDGMTTEERWVRLSVTIDGDRMTVDFDGTDPQVPASINAGASQVLSGVVYGLRCFLDHTIPSNEGVFAPLDVRLPAGTLVNPQRPYPAGGRYIVVSASVESMYQALSQARPEDAVAASGILQPFSIAGSSQERGAWLHMAFDFGGGGARRGQDGYDASGGLFGGGRNLVPQVEPIEAALPVRIEAVELIANSGGEGRWRGGRGTRTTIRVLEDAVVDTRGDRMRTPPMGAEGGGPGRPGAYLHVRPDGEVTPIPSKTTRVRLRAGDALVVETSGGGGLGEPPPP